MYIAWAESPRCGFRPSRIRRRAMEENSIWNRVESSQAESSFSPARTSRKGANSWREWLWGWCSSGLLNGKKVNRFYSANCNESKRTHWFFRSGSGAIPLAYELIFASNGSSPRRPMIGGSTNGWRRSNRVLKDFNRQPILDLLSRGRIGGKCRRRHSFNEKTPINPFSMLCIFVCESRAAFIGKIWTVEFRDYQSYFPFHINVHIHWRMDWFQFLHLFLLHIVWLVKVRIA